LSFKVVPVLCGAAFRNKGIQPLLDAVVDLLPSPLDVPPMEGKNPDSDKKVVCLPKDDAPFAALAFKIMTDPFMGQLTYFRVYSGHIFKGDSVFNSAKGKNERLGRILQMHANKREDIEEVYAGDIAATVGLRWTMTGDTFCDHNHPVVLEAMDFPEPVIFVAIEPKTQADQDKLSLSLKKLEMEDPSFVVRVDEETGQTIISGMGELHIEIIVDRLMREFKVDAHIGKPQVAYKETITQKSKGEGKYIRQTGGRGQYGHVVLEIEPMDKGKGFEFVNSIKGGVIPREYIPAVKRGVEEAMERGILAGYPVVDVRASLIDGSFHEVDSSELAFKIAGSLAVKEASKLASPILLEPIMSVEVVVPDEFVGDVLGDLNSRRGEIKTVESRAGIQVVQAFVPLTEMFGYATGLRSKTQGRAHYTMQFLRYEPLPLSLSSEIVSGLQGVG